MLNMAHVKSAKVRPSASSCDALLPAEGSATCGRYARVSGGENDLEVVVYSEIHNYCTSKR